MSASVALSPLSPIAVDGPAASGKGTIAKRLATHLGFAYLDTGLLYRAVGLGVLRVDGDPADAIAAVAAVPSALLIDPEDPALRAERTARAASYVAAIPAVRTALLALQQQFAQNPPDQAAGAVLDGRDIGTVICPEAPKKIFVTAAVEERAARRTKELLARGDAPIYDTVLHDLCERDARDRGRGRAPLASAPGAFVLDTTCLNADQAFAAALAHVLAP